MVEGNGGIQGEARSDPASGWLTRRFVLLIAVATALAGLAALMMELQASSLSWIAGQSAWSKGQQQAVHALYRYAQHGRPDDLADAHRALAIPLGDRIARLALEQDPPDLELAREGFRQGGNNPLAIPRLVSSYRYGRHWPHLRDAVQMWRLADVGILQLQTAAHELEAAYREGPLPEERVAQFQQQLERIGMDLRQLELGFSQALLDGARAARQATLVLTALSLLHPHLPGADRKPFPRRLPPGHRRHDEDRRRRPRAGSQPSACNDPRLSEEHAAYPGTGRPAASG
jgi:hypothetical protein